MKTPTVPFAALLGLPPRKKQVEAAVRPKARRREPRPVAAPVRKKFASRAEHRGSAPRAPTFAELLDAALPAPSKVQRRAARAIADVQASHPEGLTPTARRIIALGAAARGEALPEDGIEAQLKRDRDEACGIGSVARLIINSTNAAPREAQRLATAVDAQLRRERDAAFGITPAVRAIIDRETAQARIAAGVRAATGAVHG